MTSFATSGKLQLHTKEAKSFYATQLARISGEAESEAWLFDNVKDFLKKKLDIEKECQEKLEKLAKATQKVILKEPFSKMPVESPTPNSAPSRNSVIASSPSVAASSRDSLEAFSIMVSHTETSARNAIELIDQLNTEVLDVLRDQSKLQLTQSQENCDFWRKTLDHIESNLYQLNDAKQAYDEAVKNHDQIRRKYSDALNGHSNLFANMKHAFTSVSDEQRIEKLAAKLKLAKQLITQTRNAYLLHLVAYNVSQHQFWDHDLPSFLSKFYEQNDLFYSKCLLSYSDVKKQSFQFTMDQMKLLDEKCKLVDLKKERQSYVQENEKYFNGKSIFEFEPKGNDLICEIISDEFTKSSLSSQLSELILQRDSYAKQVDMNVKELSGLYQMAELYEKKPEFGNVNDLLKSKLSLEHTTMLLKNKLKQHEEQIKLLMSLGVEPAVAEPVVAEPVVEEPIVEGESAQDKNPSTPVSLHFTTSSHEDNVPPTSDDSLLNYKRARVLYSYVASVEGGVSVEPGQEIHILEGDADGWTKIKCNDIEGFVPSNYLEVIQEDPKGSFISTNVNLSLSRSHKTTLLTVLLDYTSVNPGELSMVVGDTIELLEQASTNSDHSGDWKLGKNLRTNEEGLFPFLFTQQLSSLSTPTTGLTYPSSSEKVKADYDFQPTSEGDLELHLGDIILVINKNTGSEGWWLGTNLNTQLSGLFPYSYTSTLEK